MCVAKTSAGKGTVTIQVRWYTSDGNEKWSEIEIRPDPFWGNEVTIRDPIENPKTRTCTGCDVSKLVCVIATGKYREIVNEKLKK